MSTATYAPTSGAAASDAIAAAKIIRDQAVSAAMWPVTVAKRILAAIGGGWKAAYGLLTKAIDFVADATKVVPTSIKSVLLAAPFSTEGGYERIRTGAHWLTRKVLGFGSVAVLAVVAGATFVSSFIGGAISMVHEATGVRVMRVSQSLLNTFGTFTLGALKAVAGGVDYVFATLGHRVAVTTVTTGATAITLFAGVEAVSLLATEIGILPTTLSGVIAGTPFLAGLPLMPALLTSVGVVAVSLLTLVTVGGLAAFLFRKAEIDEMVTQDREYAASVTTTSAGVVIPGEVIQAETEQMLAEAETAKAAKAVAEEIIDQARNGNKPRHHGGKRNK